MSSPGGGCVTKRPCRRPSSSMSASLPFFLPPLLSVETSQERPFAFRDVTVGEKLPSAFMTPKRFQLGKGKLPGTLQRFSHVLYCHVKFHLLSISQAKNCFGGSRGLPPVLQRSAPAVTQCYGVGQQNPLVVGQVAAPGWDSPVLPCMGITLSSQGAVCFKDTRVDPQR